MSDEHDSWFKSAFGVDLGDSLKKIESEAKTMANQAANTVKQVVQDVRERVEEGLDGIAKGATAIAKKVAGAVSPPGGGSKNGAPVAGGGTGSFPLGGSVGRGGKNAPNDVRAVQQALGIAADGQCGAQTIASIEAFQRSIGQAKPDGRVDAGGATERALASGNKGGAARPATPPAGDEGGLLGGLAQKAGELVDDAKELGGRVLQGAGELLDDAKELGGKMLQGVGDAAGGVLGSPGALLNDASGAGGLQVTGKFHHELPEAKFFEFGQGSYVKGSLKYKSEITGEIVKGGSTAPVKLTGTTNGGGKAEIELGKQKVDELTNQTLRDVLKALNVEELKETFGIEISAKKVDINIAIEGKIATDASWLSGTVKGKFVLASMELEKLEKDPTDFNFTSVTIEGGFKGENVIPLDGVGLPGFGLKVQVTGVVSGSVGPNWGRILGDAAKKAAEQGAKEASKQLAKGAQTAAIDLAIDAGLILVAIGVVVGTAHELAVAGEERQLVANVTGACNQFETGLGQALRGDGRPGGGWPGKGWDAGNRVFQQALQKAQRRFPDSLPDEVRQAAINSCVGPSKSAEIKPKIVRAVGEIFWAKWIDGHHGRFDTPGEAKRACGICFQRAVTSDSDPDLAVWKKVSNFILG